MKNKKYNNIFLIGIVIALILGSFNISIVGSEGDYDIISEKISDLVTLKESRNEKIDQGISNLLEDYTNGENIQIKESILMGFDIYNEKVRLEIIISDEYKIENLTNFNKNIEIETSYRTLVQALVPFNLIQEISKQQFVQFIRKPLILKPCVTSEGVGVIGADQIHSIG